jgi:predicted RNA-binding protein
MQLVYNCDLSGLLYRMPPDQSIGAWQILGAEKDQTGMLVSFMVNVIDLDLHMIFISYTYIL